MKSESPTTAEVRVMLTEMAAEVEALKTAASGPVTDAVAAWLAPQYLVASREKLAATPEAQRWEVLRAFAQD